MDTAITEVARTGSVALVAAEIVAANIGDGASRVMGLTLYPSRRTANSSTGTALPITMLTTSTTNGAVAPEPTSKCNHPPAWLRRSMPKHRSGQNCSYFRMGIKPTSNWSVIAGSVTGGQTRKWDSTQKKRRRAQTIFALTQLAWKPATT